MWSVRISEAAEADFREIVRWTAESFGDGQARTYGQTLSDAITALHEGPKINGVRTRDDIAKGIFTLHVARNRRRGRHLVMFRIERSGERNVIDVLRILHDAMDPAQRLPSDPPGP